MQKYENNRDNPTNPNKNNGRKVTGKLRRAFKRAHRYESTDRDGDQHRAQRCPLSKLTPSEPQRQSDNVGNSETDKHRIQHLHWSIPAKRPRNSNEPESRADLRAEPSPRTDGAHCLTVI